jgi:phosphatidylserine decarboxylase
MPQSAQGTPAGAGPQVFDRRRGECFREAVLGDRWLRLAYSPPLRCVSGLMLFRRALWSRLLGWYADSPHSRRRIPATIAQLGLDPGEFRDPVDSYASFNEFFCRHLRPGARPFDPSPGRLCSPADCRLLVFPRLNGATCVPVKGHEFTVRDLLGPGREAEAAAFADGALAVCRLCPADYHRFHYPAAGRELAHWDVPGALHSVNPLAIGLGLNVFAENRRRVTLLDLEAFGRCAFVEVGAFGVARIVQTHARGTFARMAEKGYFCFGGSTIVLVFTAAAVAFDSDLIEHSAAGREVLVRCGETVGSRGRSGRDDGAAA